nr:lipoprotein LpqV [Mycobacterium europaeum]
MRWCGRRPRLWGPLVMAAALVAATGCSPGAPTRTPASSPARPADAGPGAAPPGAVGLSPSGVTTRVDVPANSTEEEYYQACHAAKVWMDAQPRTDESRFEPYLAMVQAAPSGTAGSWNARWADLPPARQAAVITAARAAANGECD